MIKKQAEKTEKIEETVKKALEEMLSFLEIEATAIVSLESADHFQIEIQTQETGLLIGFHGETINSLQLLLGVLLYKKLGKWIHVVLDVGGYRKMRQDHIQEMVGRIITEVETTNQPVVLPFLTPLERRIVHMMLSDNEKITSESAGEGKERRVSIKPRETSS